MKDWKLVRTLHHLADGLHKNADEMTEVVRELLTEPLYTKRSILSTLEVTETEFKTLCLSSNTQSSKFFLSEDWQQFHLLVTADEKTYFVKCMNFKEFPFHTCIACYIMKPTSRDICAIRSTRIADHKCG